MLQLLASYSYLRTDHFYELLGASSDTRKRAVRRTLMLMRRAGCVTAEPVFEYREHVRGGFPHSEFVYRLTAKGGRHVQSDAEHLTRSPGSILHDLAVSEFHLALHRGFSAAANVRLHWLTGRLKKTVNPDAIFGLEDVRRPPDRGTFWFFLELERSRQGHWRRGEDSGLLQKLRRYAHYRGSSEQRAEWPFIGDFRVIVSVASDRRAGNLLDKLRRMLPLRMIWIVSTPDACDDVMNAVFRCPADDPEAIRSMASLVA
jgi:Replication-relaxation